MAHSSYTTSERRGLLVIALIALLIVGSGVVLGLCGRNTERVEEIPIVEEHPEMIDTTVVYSGKDKSPKSKNKSGSTDKKKNNKKDSKTYRRREPWEEPV